MVPDDVARPVLEYLEKLVQYPILTTFPECPLVSYFDEIGERWSEVTYAGGGNVVWNGIWATIKTGGSIIGDAAQSVWNGIKSLFTTESGEDTGAAQDTLSDDGMELQIVQILGGSLHADLFRQNIVPGIALARLDDLTLFPQLLLIL